MVLILRVALEGRKTLRKDQVMQTSPGGDLKRVSLGLED